MTQSMPEDLVEDFAMVWDHHNEGRQDGEVADMLTVLKENAA